VQYFVPLMLLFLCALLLSVVGLLCIGLLFLRVFLLHHVYYFIVLCVLLSYILYCVYCCLTYCTVCTVVLHTLDAWLLARGKYPEGPATGHLDTGFSWFPCVYKRMLRWFPTHQVATACFSCSPPDLNFLDPYFIFMYMHYNHCHWVSAHLQLNILFFFL